MLLGISSLTSVTNSSPFNSVMVPGTDKSCKKGETISCLNLKLHSSYVRTIFKSPGKSSEPEGCVRLKTQSPCQYVWKKEKMESYIHKDSLILVESSSL